MVSHAMGVGVRRLLACVSGLAALAGAVVIFPPPLLAVHSFVPSNAQLAVAKQSAWTIPSQCSSGVSAGNGPSQVISRADNDKAFTVYPHDFVQVDATQTNLTPTGDGSYQPGTYNAVFSHTKALCGLNSGDDSQLTCFALRPGVTTIYFPAPSLPLAIVELRVIAGGPPSPAPSIALGVLGLGLIGWAVMIGPGRRRGRIPADFRRADDAQRSPSLDPAAFSRKAWDEFDKRPGPGI